MKYFCDCCGKKFEGEPYLYVNGDHDCPLCEECYSTHTTMRYETPYSYAQCHDCGDVYDNDDTHGYFAHFRDGSEQFVCQHCLDMNCYEQCVECGEYYEHGHDETYETVNGAVVCEDCASDRCYTRCEDCGLMVPEDLQVTISTRGGGSYTICEECFRSGDYCSCDDCGEIYHVDDLEYPDDDSDERYCPNCGESHVRRNNRVLSYDEEHRVYLDPLTVGATDGYEYVGFELEYIDSSFYEEDPTNSNAPTRIFRELQAQDMLDMAKSTRDCTVSGEVVTAPMSMEYLNSEDGFARLGRLCNIIKNSGCVAWDSKFHKDSTGKFFSCGGHIHVSHEFADPYLESSMEYKTVAIGIARLVSYTQQFWHRVSGRREVSPWAVYDTYCAHRSAINYTDNTYEFRFWQGTLEPNTLRTRAFICTNLVRYVANKPDLEHYLEQSTDQHSDLPAWEELHDFFENWLPNNSDAEQNAEAMGYIYGRLNASNDNPVGLEYEFIEWFKKFFEEKYKENK